jgi:hypothetical protein
MQGSLPAGWLASTGRESNSLDRFERFPITPWPSPFPALRLTQACYLPVISLLSANYLPVMVLFRARRRFSINPLKTNGFRRILEARIAPEQGEKGG